MELKDTYKPRMGLFKLEVIDRHDRIIETYEDENLIVLTGRTAVRNILSDTSLGNQGCITRVAAGTASTDTAPEDEDLTDKTWGTIIDVEYPDDYSSRFIWELGYGEGNGKTITEYGLYTENESLFARKVRPPLVKDSFISLRGEWTILF